MHYFGWLDGSTPERSTENLDHVYQRLVEEAEAPYSVGIIKNVETVVPKVAPWKVRDPFGYVIAASTMPIYPKIFVRVAMRTANARGTALLIAVRQAGHDQARQLESLAELVPSYLAKQLIDPFDGKEFRYVKREPGRSIIYSVGPNQLDEGGLTAGKPPRDAGEKGDLVFCECELAERNAQVASKR